MRNILPIIALLFLFGCATFNDNAGKVLATAATAVDSSMKSYAQYLKIHPLPPSKQRPIQDAYTRYQLTMAAAEKAYIELVKTGDRTAWSKASASLTASQSEILAAVAAITGKATK